MTAIVSLRRLSAVLLAGTLIALPAIASAQVPTSADPGIISRSLER